MLTNLYPPAYLGGYELLCAQVTDALRARGHAVVVLTSQHGDPQPRREETIWRTLQLEHPWDRAVAGRQRGRRWWVTRVNAAETRRALAHFQPELVFGWSQGRVSLGPVYAVQEVGTPLALTMNDFHWEQFVPPVAHGRARLLQACDATVLRHNYLGGVDFSRVTCISAMLRAQLVAHGVPVADARIIFQGIPLEQFPRRDALGGLHAPARLLYVGQLHAYKGVHTVIEALAIASHSQRPATLTIAGTGPEEYGARLHRLAEHLHVADAVTFLGKVPPEQLSVLYREHDMFVFPSIWPEPFGLTHLEAMASGLPVISTINGGQGEFLREGENALTFLPEDANGLAQQINRLLTDAALRRRLSDVGRRVVEHEFTIEAYVDRLEPFLLGSVPGA